MDTTLYRQNLEFLAMQDPEYQRELRSPEIITNFANKLCQACDNNDAKSKSIYLSILVLKYWDTIDRIYEKIHTADKTKEDAVALLEDNILLACDKAKGRKWLTTKKYNAQQCIAQVIKTRGTAQVLYESNLKKNKAGINQVRLDKVISDDGKVTTVGDLVPNKENLAGICEVRDIIRQCIRNNHIIEAIIMDNMAFKDCENHETKIISETDSTGETKKYTRVTSEFKDFNLVKELNDLGQDYVDYFISTYHIAFEKFKVAFDTLVSAPNAKKYKYVNKTKEYGRTLSLQD